MNNKSTKIKNTIRFAAVGDLLLTSPDGHTPGRGTGALSPEIINLFKSCDIVFANLECTLAGPEQITTEPRVLSTETQIRSLSEAGVSIVSLGNNHTFDCFDDGFIRLRDLLNQIGIKWAGAGLNEAEALNTSIVEIEGIKTAFLCAVDPSSGMYRFAKKDSSGVALLETDKICRMIRDLKQTVDHVIVSPHWGLERFRIPSPKQIGQGKSFVDAGASAVLGHHPHVLQGMQFHSKFPVAFSLGNFIASTVYWSSGDHLTWNRFERTGCIFLAELNKKAVLNVKQIPVYDDGRQVSIEKSGWGEKCIVKANHMLEKGVTEKIYQREAFYVEKIKPILNQLKWAKVKQIRPNHFIKLYRHMTRSARSLVLLLIFILLPVIVAADEKPVSSFQEFKMALQQLEAGDTVLVPPGVYPGGFGFHNVHGSMEHPVVIAGQDPEDPPVFTGRGEGIKVSNVSYIKFKNLHFAGFTSNGINIDDGGNKDAPSHHIILEKITLRNIGPKGNNDAVKFSGVDHFIIQDCIIEGWGGSGVDLVGCHQGIVDSCRFSGIDEYRNKNGIQIKGGSRNILIQNSVFMNSGERMVQIGGSTGAAFFRPASADYEAMNVIVAGNVFIGGEAQLAWVTSRNSRVHNNIFFLPEKYVGRILQESRDKRFKPCQNGLFEANLVVTDQRVKTFFNVGQGTLSKTFKFSNNAWYRYDSNSKPKLPVRETGGVYGVCPELEDFGRPEMRIGSQAAELYDIGPGVYVPQEVALDFTDIKIPEVIQ